MYRCRLVRLHHYDKTGTARSTLWNTTVARSIASRDYRMPLVRETVTGAAYRRLNSATSAASNSRMLKQSCWRSNTNHMQMNRTKAFKRFFRTANCLVIKQLMVHFQLKRMLLVITVIKSFHFSVEQIINLLDETYLYTKHKHYHWSSSLQILLNSFVLRSKSSRERKFQGAKILGTFVPGSESFREREFQGTKMELSLLSYWAKVPVS